MQSWDWNAISGFQEYRTQSQDSQIVQNMINLATCIASFQPAVLHDYLVLWYSNYSLEASLRNGPQRTQSSFPIS